jgi:hypothetical protein
MSQKERVYLITYNKQYYNCGKIANILGIKRVTQYNTYNVAISSKLSYHIQFEDGQEDYVPIELLSDTQADWHLVTLAELLRVGMPR